MNWTISKFAWRAWRSNRYKKNVVSLLWSCEAAFDAVDVPESIQVLSDQLRDMKKNNYPILLVFWPVFFVAIKLKYLDMLASSRLEYEPKSFAIWGN